MHQRSGIRGSHGTASSLHWALFFIALAVAGNVFADTVRLKNGNTLEGRIESQNEREIVLGVPGLGNMTITRDEVAAIEDSPVPTAPPVPVGSRAAGVRPNSPPTHASAPLQDLDLASMEQIVQKENGPNGETYFLNTALYDAKGAAAWRRAASYPPNFANDQEREETVKVVQFLIKVVEILPHQFESSGEMAQRAANNYRMAVNLDIPDVQQQLALAKQWYELALKMTPKDASAYELYGSFLCSVSECEKGYPYLEKARVLGSILALYDLGLMYSMKDDDEKAIQYLEQYLKAQPSDERAMVMLEALRNGATRLPPHVE